LKELNKEKVFPSIVLILVFCLGFYYTIAGIVATYTFYIEGKQYFWVMLFPVLFLLWLSITFLKGFIRVVRAKSIKEIRKVFDPTSVFNPFKV